MFKFKIGDIVYLKSGGPPMTVIYSEEGTYAPMVWCKWFNDGQPSQEAFPQDALEYVSDEENCQ